MSSQRNRRNARRAGLWAQLDNDHPGHGLSRAAAPFLDMPNTMERTCRIRKAVTADFAPWHRRAVPPVVNFRKRRHQ